MSSRCTSIDNGLPQFLYFDRLSARLVESNAHIEEKAAWGPFRGFHPNQMAVIDPDDSFRLPSVEDSPRLRLERGKIELCYIDSARRFRGQ